MWLVIWESGTWILWNAKKGWCLREEEKLKIANCYRSFLKMQSNKRASELDNPDCLGLEKSSCAYFDVHFVILVLPWLLWMPRTVVSTKPIFQCALLCCSKFLSNYFCFIFKRHDVSCFKHIADQKKCLRESRETRFKVKPPQFIIKPFSTK